MDFQEGSPSTPTGFLAALTDTAEVIDLSLYAPSRTHVLPRLTLGETEGLQESCTNIAFDSGLANPVSLDLRGSYAPSHGQLAPSYVSRIDQDRATQLGTVRLSIPIKSVADRSYLAATMTDVASLVSTAALALESMPRSKYEESATWTDRASGAATRDDASFIHRALIGKLTRELSGFDCGDPNIKEIRKRMERANVAAQVRWESPSAASESMRSNVTLWGMSADTAVPHRAEITWTVVGPRNRLTFDGTDPETKVYGLTPRPDLSQVHQGSMRLAGRLAR